MNRAFKAHLPGGLWTPLAQKFQESAPLEDGAFLEATWDGSVLRACSIIDSPEVPWDWQHERSLKPSTKFLNRVAARTQATGRVAVFVHTHPMGWAAFSSADEWAHDAWAPFFQRNAHHGCFASIVWAMEDWYASIWTPKGRQNTTMVLVT